MAPINPDRVGNVIDLIKAGEYIQAIKLRREETGEGLKEAKEYVDNIRFGIELKVLKCKSIDEMRTRVNEMRNIQGNQREFLLDVIDEAYYLGEDSGHSTGYATSLEENTGRRSDEDEEWEEEIYSNGYSDGRQEGMDEGYETGINEGSEQSYNEGFDEGKAEGYRTGLVEGRVEGYENGHQTGLEQGRAERND